LFSSSLKQLGRHADSQTFLISAAHAASSSLGDDAVSVTCLALQLPTSLKTWILEWELLFILLHLVSRFLEWGILSASFHLSQNDIYITEYIASSTYALNTNPL
jgi:hypothetical protein